MNHPQLPPDVVAEASRALRDALGAFATGITVVTAALPDGRRIGVTINSFSSLSLDPPLVLWSLGRQSRLLADMAAATHYAVNILAEGQEEISRRFAGPAADKFAGLDCVAGIGGAPLIPGCAAVFQCAAEARHEGGDHLMFIGRVLAHAHHALPPLVFHGGRYRRLDAEGDQPRD